MAATVATVRSVIKKTEKKNFSFVVDYPDPHIFYNNKQNDSNNNNKRFFFSFFLKEKQCVERNLETFFFLNNVIQVMWLFQTSVWKQILLQLTFCKLHFRSTFPKYSNMLYVIA